MQMICQNQVQKESLQLWHMWGWDTVQRTLGTPAAARVSQVDNCYYMIFNVIFILDKNEASII